MSEQRGPIIAAPCYRDARAAKDWLEAALGFETTMMIEDASGALIHCEMRFGAGVIMVAHEWDDLHRSPLSLGGKVTSSIHLHLDADIDAHCERARAAGAVIIQEPSDQFYGDRVYRCRDPEGHVWTLGQPVRAVSREDAEAALGGGVRITGWV